MENGIFPFKIIALLFDLGDLSLQISNHFLGRSFLIIENIQISSAFFHPFFESRRTLAERFQTFIIFRSMCETLKMPYSHLACSSWQVLGHEVIPKYSSLPSQQSNSKTHPNLTTNAIVHTRRRQNHWEMSLVLTVEVSVRTGSYDPSEHTKQCIHVPGSSDPSAQSQ